jgi:hypothetical protein
MERPGEGGATAKTAAELEIDFRKLKRRRNVHHTSTQYSGISIELQQSICTKPFTSSGPDP